jgi:hypothetical protein
MPTRWTPSSPLSLYTIPPRSPPIRLSYDLRQILAGELDLMRHREKTEPYYRGETPTRPDFLDHDVDSDSDTEMSETTSETGSDFTMASEADDDGYIIGDAPVHAVPVGRWSAGFLQDAGGFGLQNHTRRVATPPPPPRFHFKPLTHLYTRAELEDFGFESILKWSGYVTSGRAPAIQTHDFQSNARHGYQGTHRRLPR